MATVGDIRYTLDSLKLQDSLQSLVVKKLRALVIEKVEKQKRSLVTAEDVKACVPEALRQTLSDLQDKSILEQSSNCSQ
jgi:hypothetical protein